MNFGPTLNSIVEVNKAELSLLIECRLRNEVEGRV
jgi:hypothetical protein